MHKINTETCSDSMNIHICDINVNIFCKYNFCFKNTVFKVFYTQRLYFLLYVK